MEMATHYAFVIYCMEVIALLGWIIILCKANGGIIFEVQTFRNSQKEIEVSPRGVRIFSKWVGGISGIIMIGILGKVIMPDILWIPNILKEKSAAMPKESAMLTGVIFSNYKGKIAFIWIVIIIMLFVMIEKRLLRTLTKRVKEKKEYTEIYLWGREYSILLLLQAFVTSVCLIILVGCLAGGYTKSVEKIWKVSVWVEYVLVFINGMYAHQKLFIFKNGIVTYHKYRKENFGIKEDLEIVIEKSNRVQVKFKGKEISILECTANSKRELVNVQEMLLASRKERIEEIGTDAKVAAEKENDTVDETKKPERKIDFTSLPNNSKVQVAKERFMIYEEKNNKKILYLCKGTENWYIKSAKWSIESNGNTLNIKKKITFAQAFYISFMTGYIIIAVLAMMLGIVALFSQDMVFTEKALFVCMALVMDSLCIFLCYIVNKTFNIEPIKYLYKYLDDIQREYKGV